MTSTLRDDEGVDRLIDVLASPRRRIVLEVFRARRTATLEDLTTAVLEAERGSEPVGPDERLRVRWDVRLSHVPRLIDADLVEYDSERDRLAATATTDLLFACVDRVRATGDRHSTTR